jgi:DNA mismatch endonuclease (patch repair protein)
MSHQKTIKVPSFRKSGFETSPQRSKLMAQIHSSNTKSEIILRKALWAKGIRYRINYKAIVGCPDIFIKKNNLVIFIDGEFWHGYEWEKRKPRIKSNRDYWISKIERNIQRDFENSAKLTSLGFTVIRFWEKQIKSSLDECISTIMLHFKSEQN